MRCQHCGKQFMGAICPNCNSNATSCFPPPPPPRAFSSGAKEGKKRLSPVLVLVIILGALGIIIFTLVSIARIRSMRMTEEKTRQSVSPRVTQQRLSEEEKRAKELEEQRVNGIYKAGDYEVGKDIPEGLYRLEGVGAASNIVFHLTTKPHSEMENIADDQRRFYELIDRTWYKSGDYVIVEKGQYVHCSWCKLIEIAKNPYEKTDPEKSKEGWVMLVGGHDIPTGRYLLESKNSNASSEYYMANHPFGKGYYPQSIRLLKSGEQTTVKVEEGAVLFLCRVTLTPYSKDKLITGEVPVSAAQNTKDVKVYDAGDYTVGQTCPAGLYVIYSDEDVLAEMEQSGMTDYSNDYLSEIQSNFYVTLQGSSEHLIHGNWFHDNLYIDLKDGEKLSISHGKMVAAADYHGSRDPFLQSGMYLVGKDVPAGTYKIVCDKGHETDNWSSYGIYQEPPTDLTEGECGIPEHMMSVTLKDGQYICLERCHLKQ